ncbi:MULTISPECIES: hypothetical protein [unclassified Xanthomonas]|uniref:hypothetical protein n=1 Tax=unclassified Xanthomonas TaxID=2643310 RepID=UPI002A82B1E4|nr:MULTISPECIES: hypothetical protein [unclassified Xanthomonas]MDY4295906.1 hypothetical protein [Xanthomonas sp. LF02-5]MDY4357701.1 hypothetical protein [Xanthomonas sp. LF04-12]
MTSPNARSNLGVHFFYVALILSLAIVLLITFDWTHLQGFTEYLSVAATVTSLVLGILAIIFGFVSSGTISQSLGSVESSASNFTQIAAELKAVLEGGQRAQARAEERTGQLHGLIDDMRSGLASLSETTERIETGLEAIPDRINNSKSLAPTDPPTNTMAEPSDDNKSGSWGENELKTFFSLASPIGRIAVYAAWRAKKENSYVDFSRLMEARLYTYVYGFLIASNCASVFELEYSEKEKSMKSVRLKDPSDALGSVLEQLWAKRNEKKDKTWAKVAARYEEKIEDSFVNGPAIPDEPRDVV